MYCDRCKHTPGQHGYGSTACVCGQCEGYVLPAAESAELRHVTDSLAAWVLGDELVGVDPMAVQVGLGLLLATFALNYGVDRERFLEACRQTYEHAEKVRASVVRKTLI